MLKKYLQDKRGIALESAILFMLVIFLFCSLLLGLNMSGHSQTRLEEKLLQNRVALEQVGEDFVSYGTGLSQVYENYEYEISGNTLRVFAKGDAVHQYCLLLVEINNDHTVVRWVTNPDSP